MKLGIAGKRLYKKQFLEEFLDPLEDSNNAESDTSGLMMTQNPSTYNIISTILNFDAE